MTNGEFVKNRCCNSCVFAICRVLPILCNGWLSVKKQYVFTFLQPIEWQSTPILRLYAKLIDRRLHKCYTVIITIVAVEGDENMDINNNLRQAETERITATVERYFADKFDGAYVYQTTSGAEYCTLYVALPHRAKVECDQTEYELSALFDKQTVLVRPIDMYEVDLQVEVDYPDKTLYTFAEMLPALAAAKEQASGQPLIAIGRDGKGSLVCLKLNEVVHMAVCGIASRGSDLYVQSLLASIVATNSPDEVRLMIVDTRAAMYKDFDGVPHMLFDNVATDDMQAEAQMKWLVEEMDRRYKMFAQAHCLRISEYNQAAAETGVTAMYRIVAVVDDIAEVSKEVQKRVMMLSAKARAVGICLVVKTDNPDWFRNCSVMLTNLPTRLVVQTANGQHSQRLLGWRGAEKLRNIGDAYYKSMRYSDGIRVQVAVATQKEVQQVCMSAKNQYVCDFLERK